LPFTGGSGSGSWGRADALGARSTNSIRVRRERRISTCIGSPPVHLSSGASDQTVVPVRYQALRRKDAELLDRLSR
jgi:hypothetical protein